MLPVIIMSIASSKERMMKVLLYILCFSISLVFEDGLGWTMAKVAMISLSLSASFF